MRVSGLSCIRITGIVIDGGVSRVYRRLGSTLRALGITQMLMNILHVVHMEAEERPLWAAIAIDYLTEWIGC
jgi:hypothetical protein